MLHEEESLVQMISPDTDSRKYDIEIEAGLLPDKFYKVTHTMLHDGVEYICFEDHRGHIRTRYAASYVSASQEPYIDTTECPADYTENKKWGLF